MTRTAPRGLLIGGGRGDPSLACLIESTYRAGVPVLPILFDHETEPCLDWDLATGTLTLDGTVIHAQGVFLRYDVFTPRAGGATIDRALGWYNTLLGWAATQTDVRLFNRELSPQASVKPYQLQLAAALGLSVPATWIGNDLAPLRVRASDAMIAKPVGGGAYVQPLTMALAHLDAGIASAPAPAIVQERLGYPEFRVFVIGGDTHVFEIISAQLDYRPDPSTRLDYRGPHGRIGGAVAACQALAAALRCDFAACDLKTRAGAAEPVFLEINTGPMFAAFDHAAQGALTASIIAHLTR